MPGIRLATVYRNLEILKELGIVREFDFKDGRARYEFVAEKEGVEHYHLICRICGKIIDYEIKPEEEADPLEELNKNLKRNLIFQSSGRTFNFLHYVKSVNHY